MGIRREQPGAAKAAATAGVAIGKGQRAEEDRARAEREQARAQAEAAQQAAQQKAMEFDLFKMEQRSMQDFQQELRDKQYEFDKFNKAKEWAIEKMELASRMDFQREEGDRQQEMGRLDAKLLALDKAREDGLFTGREFEFESMKFNLEQQQYGIKNPSRPLDPQKRMLDQMMRGDPGTAGGTAPGSVAPSGIDAPQVGPIPVQKMEAIAATGKTYIKRKEDGVHVEVPIQNAKKAIETGRYEWPKVLGAPEKAKYPTIWRGFGPPNRFDF